MGYGNLRFPKLKIYFYFKNNFSTPSSLLRGPQGKLGFLTLLKTENMNSASPAIVA
jgi:hypothetical protein